MQSISLTCTISKGRSGITPTIFPLWGLCFYSLATSGFLCLAFCHLNMMCLGVLLCLVVYPAGSVVWCLWHWLGGLCCYCFKCFFPFSPTGDPTSRNFLMFWIFCFIYSCLSLCLLVGKFLSIHSRLLASSPAMPSVLRAVKGSCLISVTAIWILAFRTAAFFRISIFA